MKNVSLHSLAATNWAGIHPIISGVRKTSEDFFRISESAFSMSSLPFIFSISPISLSASRTKFGRCIDASVYISSATGSDFSNFTSYTSSSTVSFLSCTFHDSTSSNYAGAILIDLSGCAITVASCSFSRITCSHAVGYTSGAFTIHNCGSVSMISSSFSQCSSSTDIASFQFASQEFTITSDTINLTREVNCGNYNGFSSKYASLAGAASTFSYSRNNVSGMRTDSYASCFCYANCPHGCNSICQNIFENCSGPIMIMIHVTKYPIIISRSIFVNDSATVAAFEFASCYASVLASECAFSPFPNVNISTNGDSYSNGFVTFDRCCFDHPISVTFESLHIFISTVSGVCIIESSNSFSVRCFSAFDPRYIFPILVSSVISLSL